MINILQACSDRKVFAPFLRGATWDAWRVFLAVLFGLPLTPEQLVLYTKYDPPPLKWSDLRYVFDIKEDCNGKEAIQA